MKKEISIFTDGACSGNPGKGGWGAVLLYEDNEKHLSGSEKLTTNNKMELKATIEGLKAIILGAQANSKKTCDDFKFTFMSAEEILKKCIGWYEKNNYINNY